MACLLENSERVAYRMFELERRKAPFYHWQLQPLRLHDIEESPE